MEPLTTSPKCTDVEPTPSIADVALTYVALPDATTLDEEQNPFEQSFSVVSVPSRPILPPIMSNIRTATQDRIKLENSTITKVSNTQVEYPDAERVSSSRLNVIPVDQIPNPADSPTETSQPMKSSVEPARFASWYAAHGQVNGFAQVKPESETGDEEAIKQPELKKRRRLSSKDLDNEEKRREFLERNRQAALKCRQRKKVWVQTLQSKLDDLVMDNEELELQVDTLQQQARALQAMLNAHKDCPVNQLAIRPSRQPAPTDEPLLQDKSSYSISGVI